MKRVIRGGIPVTQHVAVAMDAGAFVDLGVPRKRLKSDPTNTVCGITLTLWNNLMFRYLSAADLVCLQRTCKTFAGFKKMRQWIKQRCVDAFGDTPRNYWNTYCIHRGTDNLPNVLNPYHMQQPFWVGSVAGLHINNIWTYNGFGLFSDDMRLTRDFFSTLCHGEFIHQKYRIQDKRRFDEVGYVRTSFYSFRWYNINLNDLYRYRHMCSDPLWAKTIEMHWRGDMQPNKDGWIARIKG